jgi:predicted O-methyltransferase YrrM
MAWIDGFPGGLRLRRLARTIWSELTFPQSCAPGHFYSPIPARADVLRYAERIRPRDGAALPEIDLNEQAQLALLSRLSEHARRWKPNSDDRFRVENDYLPTADAIVLIAMLLETKPRQYVEIGSGFSSALVLDIRGRFLNGKLACSFIEPDTARLESLLRPTDAQTSRVVKAYVQDVGDDLFKELGAGDILFVDGSHVSKVGSDLNDILFRVLPLLQTGVLIHFHDILWPFEYRREDVLRGRSWNEAYLLRAFLANNAAYQIHLFSSWLEGCHADEWFSAFPQAKGTAASSLWLVKKGANR